MEGVTVLRVVLTGWCFLSISAVFTKDELDIVLSTLKLLKIGECILVSEIQDEVAMKKFGKMLVLTGSMGLEVLEMELQKKSKPPKAPTAIVIKTERSTTIKNLFNENWDRLHWFVWFLIIEDELDPGIRIPFNCQLFRIQKESFRVHRLIEVFHVKNSSGCSNEFGWWAPGKGLNVSSANMYKRRTDLHGVELEITVCNAYKANEMMQKFWKDTARILNFSLKMQPQKQFVVGPLKGDGSTCVWGITTMDFDQDWIFCSFGNKVKLATKFRGTNDVGWRAYVQPFTEEMWTAVGVWLLLSTAAIVIVNGFNKKSFYMNVFTGFYCLCNADPTVVHSPELPMSLPTKLVYLMSLAVPAVIVPAYSAYILSTISIVLPLEPFKDLQGFIEDGTYRLTGVENTFVLRDLRNNQEPKLKYIYENLFVGDENLAPNFIALFKQLCKDNKLAGWFIDLKSFRRMFQCRMFVMPQEVLTISTGVLLPKGSPLRKMLNERLTEYHEKGVNYRRYVQKDMIFSEEESLNSLNISQMRAIFLLLPFGVLLSLIVLAVEVIVKKRMKSAN